MTTFLLSGYKKIVKILSCFCEIRYIPANISAQKNLHRKHVYQIQFLELIYFWQQDTTYCVRHDLA